MWKPSGWRYITLNNKGSVKTPQTLLIGWFEKTRIPEITYRFFDPFKPGAEMPPAGWVYSSFWLWSCFLFNQRPEDNATEPQVVFSGA